MRTARMRWAWFRKCSDAIIGTMWSADYESILEQITRLYERVITRSGRRRVPASIRRAIADLRILAAHEKGRPMAECENLLADRMEFGFATLAESPDRRKLWK